MAVYRLRCEIEYAGTPEGLMAGNAAVDAIMGLRDASIACFADLHLCRHDEEPAGVCDPYIRNESWGGGDHA